MAGSTVATAWVEILPEMSGIQGTISKELGATADRAGQSAGKSSGGKFSAAFGVAMGAAQAVTQKAMSAVSASIGSAVARVDTLNNFPRVMQSLGYSADESSAVINQLSERLSALPTKLDDITSSVQQLAPSSESLTQAKDRALAFNDALLAGGTSAETQQNAMVQLTKAVSTGKMEMDSWMSIQEAMPGQLTQVAKAMLGQSASASDLYEAMKDGKVTVDQFADAMVELDQKGGEGVASFYDQALNATGGISTAFSNMQNAVTKGVAKVIDAIGTEGIVAPINAVKGAINGAFGAVTGAIERVKGLGGSLDELKGKVNPLVFDQMSLSADLASDAFGRVADGALGAVGGLLESQAAADLLNGALGLARDGLGIMAGAFDAAVSVAGQFFGRLAENGALSTLGELASGAAQALVDLSGDISAAVGDLASWAEESGAAQAAADLLKAALDGLKAGFEFVRDNGDAVKTALVAVAAGFAAIKVSKGISDGVQKIKDIGAAVDLAKGALSSADLAGKIGGVSDAIGALSSGGAAGALSGIAGKMSTLAAGAAQAGGGITGLSTALGLGPWGLVAAGIAAVVAGLVWFFTQTEVGKRAWSDFTSFLSGCWDGIVDGVSGAASSIGEFFTSTIPSAVGSAADAVAGTVDAIVSTVVSFFTVALPQAFDACVQFISGIPGKVAEFLAQLPVLIATGLGLVIGVVAGFAVTIGQAALQAGTGFVTWLGSALAALPGNIAAWLSGAVASVVAWATQMAASAASAGSQFVSNAGAFISQLPGNVAAWLSTAISSVLSWVAQMASNAISAGSQFLSNVGTFISQLPGNVAAWLSSAISAVAGFVTSLAARAVEAGNGFLNGIRSGFQSAVGFVRGIPGQITGFFAGAGSWLVNSGRALLDGFTSGIRNGFAAAKNAVSDGLAAVRRFFPFSPAKEGPFSGAGYTTYSGRALMDDWARAMVGEVPAVEGMVGAALSGVGAQFDMAVAPQRLDCLAGSSTIYNISIDGATVRSDARLAAAIEAVADAAARRRGAGTRRG